MEQVQLAKVYAKALLEIGTEKKSLDALETELDEIVTSLQSDSQVWLFLISPRVDRDSKTKAIESAFKGKVSDVALMLLRLLIKNDRISLFKQIVREFSLEHDKIKGRLRAQVYSAVKLSSEDATDLRSALGKVTGSECVLETFENPDLIGGIVVKFQDKIIDGSMKSRLMSIKQKMLEGKLGAYYEN